MKHVVGLLLCCQFLCACASAQSPSPTPERLAKILLGYDEHERVAATLALGKLGKVAVPALAPLLAHEDETARYYALWALSAIGPDAAATLPRILELASDPDDDVRDKAVYALGKVGKGSKEVFAFLVKRCRDKSPPRSMKHYESRIILFNSLAEFGLDAVPVLRECVKNPGVVYELYQAVDRLAESSGGVSKTLPRELQHLAFELEDMFCQAWDEVSFDLRLDHACNRGTFERFRGCHAEYLAFVRNRLEKNESSIRAAMLLRGFAAGADRTGDQAIRREVLALLAPFAKHCDWRVRSLVNEYAFLSAAEGRKLLRVGLHDEHGTVRAEAAHRCKDEAFVNELRKEFAAKTGAEKLSSARLLYDLRSNDDAAATAGAALRGLLKDRDATIRIKAAVALLFRDDLPVLAGLDVKKVAVPVLLQGLRHPNDDLRIQSSQILTKYAAMEQVAQAMHSLADDSCVEVRRNALAVLASYLSPDAPNFGPAEKKMAEAAALFLDDKDQAIRRFAVECLEWSNFGAAPLARAVVRCEERLTIARALAKERKDNGEAAPILRPLLDDPERWRAACVALATIAPDEHFARMLGALEKFEAESAGLFEYPREIRSQPSRLVAALIKDVRQPAKQSQAVRGLAAIYPILPPPQKSDLHRLMPLWSKLLDSSVKVLESKDGDHRGAIRAVFDLHRLTDEMLEPIEFPTNLNEQERSAVMHHSLAIQAALDQARSDSDLQVRRVARRAQMEQPGRREFGGRRRLVTRPD